MRIHQLLTDQARKHKFKNKATDFRRVTQKMDTNTQIYGIKGRTIWIPNKSPLKCKPQRGLTMKNKWKNITQKMNTSVYEVYWIPPPQI